MDNVNIYLLGLLEDLESCMSGVWNNAWPKVSTKLVLAIITSSGSSNLS